LRGDPLNLIRVMPAKGQDMLTSSARAAHASDITVIGAGVAGTWQALMFARAGCRVRLLDRDAGSLATSASHCAGGMLAPFCESESAEPVILRLGLRSLALWREELPDTPINGSLVVAHARDRADFERFARLTGGHRRIDGAALARLEPDLAGRFPEALYYPQEGHVEPRRVLSALHERLRARGVHIEFGVAADLAALAGLVIDCRGLGARPDFVQLRGVKGEFAVVETREVTLSRPIRLLHPRWPLYVVPRANHRFFIGATSIESEDDGISVRSALELMTAAYALHPAFAEARIVELGAGLRPAFPDNLPRIAVNGRHLAVNGLYRHGFLIAPALAEATVAYVIHGETDHDLIKELAACA
jgi:glycine oxidase